MATIRRDDAPLAHARSGRREWVFMITGIGVHDRTDWPFKITGMRNDEPRNHALTGNTVNSRVSQRLRPTVSLLCETGWFSSCGSQFKLTAQGSVGCP